MRDYYKYIFVVLVYRNIEVLKEFFKSLKVKDAHVIVVNSFYDNKTLDECQKVARDNGAEFIAIENRGFGYGNNVGSRYAVDNYKFDFLILSNSDIEIKQISYLDNIDPNIPAVIAPYIHLRDGKIQNPNIPWNSTFLIPILNFAYKRKSKKWLYIPRIWTRGTRELFCLYQRFIKKFINRKEKYEIYSCHGAFIIFTKAAVKELMPFFNDKMFLYNEELFLAENCRFKNIPIYFCPSIDVLHLEGASSSGNREVSYKHNKQSFQTLYDWWKEKCTTS